ncbi:MAG: cell division protein FtsZ [Clostridia bacterium]|nr:cell division protein FtsZ [Clostridia bacterium]
MTFEYQNTNGNYGNSQEPYLQNDYNAQAQVSESEPVWRPISQKKEGIANIVVVGVGGGGCNAVNSMVNDEVRNVSFAVMNTDKMALDMSRLPEHCKIQLGKQLTRGLGAGANPDVGRKAAEESRQQIKAGLTGADMVFLTVGMGGGTGTGAAPVVASIARELGILTVAVVTRPFEFEGIQRKKNAEKGIAELSKFVDTLLIIPNQRLIDMLPKGCFMQEAYKRADDILKQAVIGVSNLITNPGYINVDFADVRTVLTKSGLAHIGVGSGEGEDRVYNAIRAAALNPLIETSLEGATSLIINFIGGEDLTLSEVQLCSHLIQEVLDPDANIVFGSTVEPDKHDVTITIIATGFKGNNAGANTHRPQTPYAKNMLQQPFAPAQQGNNGNAFNGYGQQSNGFAPQRNTFGQQSNGFAQQQNTFAPQQNGFQNNGYGQQQNGFAQQPTAPNGAYRPGYPTRPVLGDESQSRQQQPVQPMPRMSGYGSDNNQGVNPSRMDVPQQNGTPSFLRRMKDYENRKK